MHHAILLAAFLAAPAPAAAPPTPEAITRIQDAQRTFFREHPQGASQEELTAFFTGLLEGIEPSECSWAQLKQLMGPCSMVPAKRDAAQARLKQLAGEATADGFDAFVYASSMSKDDAPTAAALFGHPGYAAWKQAASPSDRTRLIGRLTSDQFAQAGAEVKELEAWFTPERSAKDLAAGVQLVDAIKRLSPDIDQGEQFRLKLLSSIVLAKEKASPEERVALAKLAKKLDNAITRGEFMDHPAPKLTFTWAQDAAGPVRLASLDDLKGKVVVLDFWATWCGPCVGSIPNVKELRAHYSPDDVAIVGVTSLQGKHYPGGAAPVDCAGDAAKEQGLMAEFMKAKGIDWTIAFSEQEVFNPDYGVNGIPHVTILDADGIVRHTDLHPADPMHEKCAKIDALLRKQGKTPPAAPKAPEPTPTDGAGGEAIPAIPLVPGAPPAGSVPAVPTVPATPAKAP
jgi:thiol-disulfide isomerase/thioredoxin